MLAPLRRKPSALPGLRRDHAHERAVQTRLILAAERALEVHLARAITAAGRRAAAAYRQHGTDAAVSKLAGVERAIGMAVKPSVTATARAFGRRVIQGGKSGYAYLGLETKAFADLDQAIAEHVAGDTADRVVGISDSLREAIRRVIERGLAENLGEEAIAELIVEATAGEIAMARARRIARTEIHNAAMFGQQAAAEASPLAFDKVWLATEDARTRESHAAANGQRVGLMSSFVLDGENGPVALQYPGDINAPAGEVINCFPGETEVSGLVRGATRHWYDGELVQITTRSGKQLSGTPNHPILTAKGWVALCALDEGHHVVSRSDRRYDHLPRLAALDVNHVEAPIKQVFDALARRGLSVRVSRLAVDFHGDRPGHDVDVVRADDVLQVGRNAPFLKHAGELPLGGPNLALRGSLSDCLAMKLGGRGWGPAARVVCRLRERLTLVRARACHALQHGFAAVAGFATGGAEAVCNDGTFLAHSGGDRFHRFARIEATNDLVLVAGAKLAKVCGNRRRTGSHDGSAGQPALDCAGRTSEAVGHLVQAEAGAVEFDRVVAVSRRRFAGHVFNLESVDGAYIAGGIIAHNCRCVCLYEPSEIGAADGEQMPIEIVTPDDRPADVELAEPVPADAEPEPLPAAELPERDLEARPYEREASEVWAADSALNLQPDGTPRTGSTVQLIGPNAFYFSPDAPEVDRDIAARPALPFGLRRPVLWHVTIPAGAAFPPGLVTEAGAGLTINSGVGAYGLVELRVTRIDRTTWGQAAPKGYVEIDDEDLRRFIEGAIEGLADRDQIDRQSAQQTANAVGIQIIGRRRLVEDETGADVVPQSVLRALADVTWTKPALARYLQRLLDGSIRDEPEPGEPSTDARVIVVEAEMVLAAAMPEPGETE